MQEEKYLTVSQLNRYIKYKLDQDNNLTNVFLKGEISNFKAHTRGHLYFTLKDESSRMNAVMFLTNAKRLTFTPTDGMKVMVTGKVSVYEATGGYQIYVDNMIEDGVGNLYIEFEKLKKKLANEGLFDTNKKKPIPKFPKRVGVVTASTGAAIRDILTTIKRRWPITEVILFPSLVQGVSAAPDIVRQIKTAETYEIDTLIIGRGGGSIEDLWCFNDEEVARTIYACKIPIISGVGHEIDFTIADFVADLRAPTPTAAAELAVPNKSDFDTFIRQIKLRLTKNLKNKIHIEQTKLKHLTSSFILTNPSSLFLLKEEKFDFLFERMKNAYQKKLESKKENLERMKNSYVLKNPHCLYKDKKVEFHYLLKELSKEIQSLEKNKSNHYLQLLGKLETLNPLLTIKRGYTITKKEGKVISSCKSVKKDDILELEFKDGTITSKVL